MTARGMLPLLGSNTRTCPPGLRTRATSSMVAGTSTEVVNGVDQHDLVEAGVVEGQPVVGDVDGLGVGDAVALDHLAGAIDELSDDVGTDDVPAQWRHHREEPAGHHTEVEAAVRGGEVLPHDRNEVAEHRRLGGHRVGVEAVFHGPQAAPSSFDRSP